MWNEQFGQILATQLTYLHNRECMDYSFDTAPQGHGLLFYLSDLWLTSVQLIMLENK